MDVEITLTPEQEKQREINLNRKEESASSDIQLKDPETDRPKSQATLLIELGSRYLLFYDADRNGYALVPRNGAWEVWPIRSLGFRHILAGEFFKLTGKGFNRNAAADALDTLEAKAVHTGEKCPVSLRVARVDGALYLDLCDDGWRVIEINPEGWRILDRSPVYFIRKPGMLPLPVPTGPGDLGKLRDLINLDEEAGHFELIVGWMLGAMRGRAPYPILDAQGEQGSGKSTTTRIVRGFIDPSTVPLRAPPKEPRDLIVSAVNNHLVCLDNLSGINPEISDTLCRFATGGGLDMRKLYTDAESVMIDIQRPVMVNGIDDICHRPDLAERAVIVHLPVIDAHTRITESKLWKEVEKHSPAIMAGLCDALSAALANEATTELKQKPRMADFAVWVTAAESALPWERGGFMKAFEKMRGRAIEEGIEASPVGSVLVEYLDTQPGAWSPTPTHLYQTLTEKAGDRARSPAWPRTARSMGQAINRIAPNLRAIGITYVKEHTHGRNYRFTVDVQARKEAHKAHKAPEPSNGAASGMGASGAHRGACANGSAQAHIPEKEAHTLKPSNDAASGALCARGAFSDDCTSMTDRDFLAGDRL